MATYLVTGATGNQGGLVVKHLLAAGAKVHAVVRDPKSANAIALREKGVVLFQGEHEKPEPAFREAAAGCSGVFLNVSVFDPSIAKAHAAAILTACRVGGSDTMQTVVLSSTANVPEMGKHLEPLATIHPFLPMYYKSKLAVEEAVAEAGYPHYTILRPGQLVHDFFLPTSALQLPQLPREAIFTTALDENTPMAYTDDEDVGKYAAAALLDPKKFSGHEFDLIGENLTSRQVRDILAKVSGLDIGSHTRTADEAKSVKPMVPTQLFHVAKNMFPFEPDVDALEKKYGIKLTRLEEALSRQKERLLESLPPKSVATLNGQ
jgi:uncharacterized protein YbjT (DUF2867 family)